MPLRCHSNALDAGCGYRYGAALQLWMNPLYLDYDLKTGRSFFPLQKHSFQKRNFVFDFAISAAPLQPEGLIGFA